MHTWFNDSVDTLLEADFAGDVDDQTLWLDWRPVLSVDRAGPVRFLVQICVRKATEPLNIGNNIAYRLCKASGIVHDASIVPSMEVHAKVNCQMFRYLFWARKDLLRAHKGLRGCRGINGVSEGIEGVHVATVPCIVFQVGLQMQVCISLSLAGFLGGLVSAVCSGEHIVEWALVVRLHHLFASAERS